MVEDIVYDIETAINLETAEQIFATRDYPPDSRLKDSLKIEASIASKKAKDYDKAALHWTTGKVVCICAQSGKDEFALADSDERKVLIQFCTWLEGKESAVLVGKSNRIFDDGFLKGRLLAQSMDIPYILTLKSYDILDFWGFGRGHPQHASLNDISLALGIGSKNGHGSDVAELVEKGDYDAIREYCMNDVVLTKAIWERQQRRNYG